MAVARKLKDSPEMAKFRRKVQSVLRAADLYSTTGGGDDHAKQLAALRSGWHAVHDMRRKLGLDTHEREVGVRPSGELVYRGPSLEQQIVEEQVSGELEERVKLACAAAPEAGEQARRGARDADIRRLDGEMAERRRWRIENGLEDPPRRF
jgi:hypothetical protein